jgi:hypothetical protein
MTLTTTALAACPKTACIAPAMLAVLGACAAPQTKPPDIVPGTAPACAPTSVDGVSSRYGRPDREEVLAQIKRIEPYVTACSQQFPSPGHRITTTWVISGSTGKVTKLDLGAPMERGLPPSPISAELAFCIADAFRGVCFIPFDKPEFRVTFPFKVR